MQNDIKSAFTNMAEENILYYEQVISDMQYFFLVLFKKLSSLLLSVYLVLKESVQEPSVTFKVLSGGSVPVPGTQVHSLVREDSACLGQLSWCAPTTEPVLRHRGSHS